MDYCGEVHVDNEALAERGRIIEAIKGLMSDRPSWFTLKPATTDGSAWNSFLKQHMAIEEWAYEALGEVGSQRNLGQFEVNRIIAHLVKDSSSQTQAERHCPSKWLMKTTTESLKAMRDWTSWDAGEQAKKGLEYVHLGGNDWKRNWAWQPSRRTSWPSSSPSGTSHAYGPSRWGP